MNSIREAVICEPLRTPIGRFGGQLRDVPAAELAKTVIEELMRRTEIPPESVDDVVLGQCYPNGDEPAIGRVAALDAGLPITVPGTQVDRRCGSGLQAIINACAYIQTGAAELIIAGGAESMSRAEHYAMGMRWARHGSVELQDRLARSRVAVGGQRFPVPGGMIETAENLRRRYEVSRVAQDELALVSHQRAVAAIEGGAFAEEIVPVNVRKGHGETVTVKRDEHPRADTNAEQLADLRPIMRSSDPEATVTAGNSSGQNDGAAVCVVTHPARAAELGLTVLGRLEAWALAGVSPEIMGIGPVPATRTALERAGRSLEEIDLIELNEAFAAQVLAVLEEWRLHDGLERVNVNGSGIALGHPVGATGARLVTTLLREMERRRAGTGLVTMCIGGGQGLAAVLSREVDA